MDLNSFSVAHRVQMCTTPWIFHNYTSCNWTAYCAAQHVSEARSFRVSVLSLLWSLHDNSDNNISHICKHDNFRLQNEKNDKYSNSNAMKSTNWRNISQKYKLWHLILNQGALFHKNQLVLSGRSFLSSAKSAWLLHEGTSWLHCRYKIHILWPKLDLPPPQQGLNRI